MGDQNKRVFRANIAGRELLVRDHALGLVTQQLGGRVTEHPPSGWLGPRTPSLREGPGSTGTFHFPRVAAFEPSPTRERVAEGRVRGGLGRRDWPSSAASRHLLPAGEGKKHPLAGEWNGPARLDPSLERTRSAVLISGLATGPPAGVGYGLGPFLAACTPRFLDISRHFTVHLFR